MMEATAKHKYRAAVVLISALAGVALFLLLYGSQVLDPAYTDWLMDGGSLSKGYFGWQLFQSANWQLPPGGMASLGYPDSASVAATDSVPLLAVILKLLSHFWDGSFQYFGWWGLICFFLQGIFGGLIASCVTRSFWQAAFGSLLFLLTPVLWQNTFYSTGMAGHWVMLAALLAFVCRRELLAKGKRPSIVWGLLGVVSIGIHAQLALVCGILCLGYCVYAVMETKQWGKSLPFLAFLTVVLIFGWLFGTFMQGSSLNVQFFGVSIQALWDPHSYSTVLRNLSNPGDYQYADFAFLGFGTLLLCVLALVWWVKPYFAQAGLGMFKTLWNDIRAHQENIAAVAFVFLACVLLGLAQPLVYLLLTLVFFVLAQTMSRKLLSIALAFCLCLQVYDASTVFQARRMHYGQVVHAEAIAGVEDWGTLTQNKVWSTVLISPAVSESVYLAPLVEAVAESGKTLNTLSYTTYADTQNWEDAIAGPQEDMIFVFTASELLEAGQFKNVFAQVGYLYQWNELVVGFVKPTLLPFPQILKADDISLRFRFSIGKNEHLRGGEDIGGIRYIYPGGLSYGPYLDLQPGQYELRVEGEGLDGAGFSFTMKEGAMEPTETLSLPGQRIYQLDVTRAVTDLEVLINNSTTGTISFDTMTVIQLD